jgi:purine-binding chemotaxis protein CheW
MVGILMFSSHNAGKNGGSGEALEIIAFRLHDQEFCVRTTVIREIRGWGPARPLPHTSPDILGVMNLRGIVIPIIDLACKLGMTKAEPNERSAIVVAEVHDMSIGLLVDGVSDILTISQDLLQPIPEVSMAAAKAYADGISTYQKSMICYLNLEHMFEGEGRAALLAAA